MSQIDFHVTDGDRRAAVTLTDYEGEGLADQLRDAIRDTPFEVVE